MKRTVSILSAALLLSVTPNYTVFSAEISTVNNTEDLKKLASSLGAETDCLDIVNYAHSEDNEKLAGYYMTYINKCNNYEALLTALMNFGQATTKGSCIGISTLEVLAHNGVIKPSDIMPGAETMHDIKYSDDVDKYITGYHVMQGLFDFEYSSYSQAVNHESTEQGNRLIDVAERSMKENRYFLITLMASNTSHAVTGIGSADGKWQFEGHVYDKCILILDSNNKDENGERIPFSEDLCIYVDSGTGNYYHPRYGGSYDDKLGISVIDDDTILNYKGMISPCSEIKTDLSEANELSLWYEPAISYDVEVTDKNGQKHDIIRTNNVLSKMMFSKTYFTDGRTFHIETDNNMGDSSSARARVNNRYRWIDTCIYGDGIFDIDEKNCTITSKNNIDRGYELILRFNEGYYPFSPHYSWAFFGHTDSCLKAEVVQNGILLKSDTAIETIIDTYNVAFDENGNYSDLIDNKQTTYITSNNSILVSFDENNNYVFFIDPDTDGIYDTKVEKGDVNSDGIIDGRDATSVLTDYAQRSVDSDERSYLNRDFADYDNNGIIDARDASAILIRYAENSVNKRSGS